MQDRKRQRRRVIDPDSVDFQPPGGWQAERLTGLSWYIREDHQEPEDSCLHL